MSTHTKSMYKYPFYANRKSVRRNGVVFCFRFQSGISTIGSPSIQCNDTSTNILTWKIILFYIAIACFASFQSCSFFLFFLFFSLFSNFPSVQLQRNVSVIAFYALNTNEHPLRYNEWLLTIRVSYASIVYQFSHMFCTHSFRMGFWFASIKFGKFPLVRVKWAQIRDPFSEIRASVCMCIKDDRSRKKYTQ